LAITKSTGGYYRNVFCNTLLAGIRRRFVFVRQGDLFDATTPPESISKLVVRRPDLVNARFALATLEMRLFRAMRARLNRENPEFQELRIPVPEVVVVSGRRPSKKKRAGAWSSSKPRRTTASGRAG
jgi:hypothetical protein